MELRDLTYFVAVFEEGSISAAARRVHISQPSVSTALAGLEHALGTVLFVRHGKGVSPTAAATQLYPSARRLLAEADTVRRSVRATPVAPVEVTLGVTRALDAARLRAVVAAAADDRGLTLRMVEVEQPCEVRVIARTQLRRGETFQPLWRERFVVALPAAHPLALRTQVRAAELRGQPFIERCHCDHARAFARRAPPKVPVAVAASEELTLALVAAGVGVAIVPAGVARDDAQVALRPISDVAVTRQVGVAMRASASPTALAAAARIVERCAAVRARARTA